MMSYLDEDYDDYEEECDKQHHHDFNISLDAKIPDIVFYYTLIIDYNSRVWGPYKEHYKGSIPRLIGLIKNKPIYNAKIESIEVHGENNIYNLRVLLNIIENGYNLTKNKYGYILEEEKTKKHQLYDII